jgi:hypothetical protein
MVCLAIEIKKMSFHLRPSGTFDISPAIYCREWKRELLVPAGRLNSFFYDARLHRVPLGRGECLGTFPAMNRWANVWRPYGTVSEKSFS